MKGSKLQKKGSPVIILILVITAIIAIFLFSLALENEYINTKFQAMATKGTAVQTINGNYTIDTPGTVISNQKISITGSVIINADNVTLKNVIITCKSPDSFHLHNQDGIIAIGVNKLKLYDVQISRCGGNGIFIQGGEGHDLSEGHVLIVGGTAIALDNVWDSVVIGWKTERTAEGIVMRNGSHHNRVVATHVADTRKGPSFYLSEDTYANQMVRNRNKHPASGRGVAVDLSGKNLWYHNDCSYVKGFAACWGRKDKGPGDYGNINEFTPRPWTVCRKGSFAVPKASCTYQQMQDALADPKLSDGDFIVIDSKEPNWPAITLTRPLWIVGNSRTQHGSYDKEIHFENITVQSAGVRLQNLFIDTLPSLFPDTAFIDVRVPDGKGGWETLE